VYSFVLFSKTNVISAIIIPILKMRRLRCREVQKLLKVSQIVSGRAGIQTWEIL
jgi:hypothetical protein